MGGRRMLGVARRGCRPILAGLALWLSGTARSAPDRRPAGGGPGREVGKPAATLRMLVSNTRDTRLLVVFGYARLVGYDPKLELVPDILE